MNFGICSIRKLYFQRSSFWCRKSAQVHETAGGHSQLGSLWQDGAYNYLRTPAWQQSFSLRLPRGRSTTTSQEHVDRDLTPFPRKRQQRERSTALPTKGKSLTHFSPPSRDEPDQRLLQSELQAAEKNIRICDPKIGAAWRNSNRDRYSTNKGRARNRGQKTAPKSGPAN